MGSVNNGNFLGILELLGKYDEITKSHLEKIQEIQTKGSNMSGQAHYLSTISQNEAGAELAFSKLAQLKIWRRASTTQECKVFECSPQNVHGAWVGRRNKFRQGY